MSAGEDFPPPPVVTLFADPAAWRRACAARIAARIAASSPGPATLALPGGRTAAAVLPELAALPFDWERITVIPTDERWVSPDDPDSNEGLIRRLLRSTGAAVIGLKTDHRRPQDATDAVDRRLAGLLPITAALVGMGEDGHVASLFPDAAPSASGAAVLAVDRPDHPRISLRPETLAAAGRVTLALAGARKWATFRRALRPEGAALPAAALIAGAGGRLTALVCTADDDG